MQITYSSVRGYQKVAKLSSNANQVLADMLDKKVGSLGFNELYSTPLGVLGFTYSGGQGLILMERACDVIRDFPREIRQHQIGNVLYHRSVVAYEAPIKSPFPTKGDIINVVSKPTLEYMLVALETLDAALQKKFNTNYTFASWQNTTARGLAAQHIKGLNHDKRSRLAASVWSNK